MSERPRPVSIPRFKQDGPVPLTSPFATSNFVSGDQSKVGKTFECHSPGGDCGNSEPRG